jgi:hypothetical protein
MIRADIRGSASDSCWPVAVRSAALLTQPSIQTGDFACSKAYSENLPHLSCMPLVVPNLEGRVWMLNVWTSISPSAQSKLGLPGAAVVSLCVWRGPEALGCLWGPSNRGSYSNHGALRIRTHAQPPNLHVRVPTLDRRERKGGLGRTTRRLEVGKRAKQLRASCTGGNTQ